MAFLDKSDCFVCIRGGIIILRLANGAVFSMDADTSAKVNEVLIQKIKSNSTSDRFNFLYGYPPHTPDQDVAFFDPKTQTLIRKFLFELISDMYLVCVKTVSVENGTIHYKSSKRVKVPSTFLSKYKLPLGHGARLEGITKDTKNSVLSFKYLFEIELSFNELKKYCNEYPFKPYVKLSFDQYERLFRKHKIIGDKNDNDNKDGKEKKDSSKDKNDSNNNNNNNSKTEKRYKLEQWNKLIEKLMYSTNSIMLNDLMKQINHLKYILICRQDRPVAKNQRNKPYYYVYPSKYNYNQENNNNPNTTNNLLAAYTSSNTYLSNAYSYSKKNRSAKPGM